MMAKTQEAGVNTDNLERGSPLGFLNTDMALWLTLAIPPLSRNILKVN
jgi:hypothetical protein